MVDQQTALQLMTSDPAVVVAAAATAAPAIASNVSAVSASVPHHPAADSLRPVSGASPRTSSRPTTSGGTPAVVAASDLLRPGNGASPRTSNRTTTSGTTAVTAGSASPAVHQPHPPDVTAATGGGAADAAAESGAMPAAARRLSSLAAAQSQNGDDAEYIPFSVTPASGSIAAAAAAEILVKFSPLDVTEYFACLFARSVA